MESHGNGHHAAANPTPTALVYPPPAAAHQRPPVYDHRDETTVTLTPKYHHDVAPGPTNFTLLLLLLLIPVAIAAVAIPLVARIARNQ